MSNPQFSTRTVLRPYSGFSTIYSGVDASTNYIPLTPDGIALDEFAGSSGYDPYLVRGLRVPEGARLIVKLPYLMATATRAPVTPYTYRFIWRSRSLSDYQRNQAISFHDATDQSGVPDTGDPRFPIAACSNAIVYNQAEPLNYVTTVAQNLRCEEITVCGDPAITVLLPQAGGGSIAGAIQQGMEPASGRAHVKPRWVAYSTVAYSDELVLAVRRGVADAAVNWGFGGGGADEDFYNYFTSPYEGVGVLVEVGTAAT